MPFVGKRLIAKQLCTMSDPSPFGRLQGHDAYNFQSVRGQTLGEKQTLVYTAAPPQRLISVLLALKYDNQSSIVLPQVKRTSGQSQILTCWRAIEEILKESNENKFCVCFCLLITSAIFLATIKPEDIVHLTMNYEIEMSRKSHGEGESAKRGLKEMFYHALMQSPVHH